MVINKESCKIYDCYEWLAWSLLFRGTKILNDLIKFNWSKNVLFYHKSFAGRVCKPSHSLPEPWMSTRDPMKQLKIHQPLFQHNFCHNFPNKRQITLKTRILHFWNHADHQLTTSNKESSHFLTYLHISPSQSTHSWMKWLKSANMFLFDRF